MKISETIQALTSKFVEDLIAAIQASPLNELLNEGAGKHEHVRAPRAAKETVDRKSGKKSGKKTGRLARRTTEQFAETVASVVHLLSKNPGGLRAEHIRAKLDLDPREVPGVLKKAIAAKEIRVLGGQKRATVYSVGKAKAEKKIVKKAKAKKAKPVKKAKARAKKAKPAKKAKVAPKPAPAAEAA